MLRVKLKCGDRSVLMAYTSMADILAAAADRLACPVEQVILKIEEDGAYWEIEGEAMLKSAVADKNVIYAFSLAHRTKRARAELTANRASTSRTPIAPARPSARTSPGSPSSHSSKGSIGTVRTRYTPSASAADEANKSSGRKWTEKDNKHLWSSLDKELKTLPPPNPVYSLEDRREMFERLIQKHPRKFAGRTVNALQDRVQKRVLEIRKQGKRLPNRINALFPITRARSGQPVSQPYKSTRSGPTLSHPQPYASGSMTENRAATSPVNVRRRYEGDVIRVQAIEEHGSSSGDSSDSDNGGVNDISDEQDSAGNAGRTSPDPRAAIVPRRAWRSVDSNVTDSDPATSVQTPPPPSNTAVSIHSPVPNTPIKEEDTTLWHVPIDEVPPSLEALHAKPMKVEDDIDVSELPATAPSAQVLLRTEVIRAQMRASVDEAMRMLDPEGDCSGWAARLYDRLMEMCQGRFSASSPFSSSEVAFCLHSALDEFHRHTYSRSRSPSGSRSVAVGTVLRLEALYAHFKTIVGFDVLLCRFFHAAMFEDDRSQHTWTANVVATCALLLPLQVYESMLDGIFAFPWRVQQNESRSSRTRRGSHGTGASQSENIFGRIADLLEALEVMASFIRRSNRPKSLARQRGKAPRFRVNAWRRIFEETDCQSFQRWRNPKLFEIVRTGMERWDRAVVCDRDFGGEMLGDSGGEGAEPANSGSSKAIGTPLRDSTWRRHARLADAHLQSPPAHNTRSNAASSAASSQQLFFGLPDLSQSSQSHW